MSLYQGLGVAVTALLCMLDGFDIFAVTFAAPAIKAAWRIDQAQLGLVLSSGLIGIAAGSLIIAPAADLIGRRRMIFLSLLLMVAGDLASSVTHSAQALMLTRVVAGLGIGTMVAIITSLAAEYANARRRDLCMTIMSVGFPLGGMVGGFIAAYLLPTWGWPAIFRAAAGFGILMLVVSLAFLPEPIAPMIARPKRDTLRRVNRYLRRCGMDAITDLPSPPAEAKFAPWKVLFGPGRAGVTVLITSIYFLHVVTLFFVMTWVPALVSGEGFPAAQAALAGVCVNLGGICGGLLLGATSMRLGLKTMVVAGMGIGAAMTATFGSIPASFPLLALSAATMGVCLQGAMMGLYAVVARTFPAHLRASGTGLVIGVGRIGSAVGPALAGQLLVTGLARSSVAPIMAVPALLAALLLILFKVSPPDTP